MRVEIMSMHLALDNHWTQRAHVSRRLDNLGCRSAPSKVQQLAKLNCRRRRQRTVFEFNDEFSKENN